MNATPVTTYSPEWRDTMAYWNYHVLAPAGRPFRLFGLDSRVSTNNAIDRQYFRGGLEKMARMVLQSFGLPAYRVRILNETGFPGAEPRIYIECPHTHWCLFRWTRAVQEMRERIQSVLKTAGKESEINVYVEMVARERFLWHRFRLHPEDLWAWETWTDIYRYVTGMLDRRLLPGPRFMVGAFQYDDKQDPAGDPTTTGILLILDADFNEAKVTREVQSWLDTLGLGLAVRSISDPREQVRVESRRQYI